MILATAALGAGTAFLPGQGSFERTLQVSEPVDLDVTSEIGGIILTTGPVDSVRIHAILTPQLGPIDVAQATERIRALEANPPIEQTGNRIRIGYPSNPQLLDRISMRLEITAPPNTVIRARTGSGGIRVDGIAGPVDSESRSGRIQLGDISGEIRATTQSGSILIQEAGSSVVARNGSGFIEAVGVAGTIEATTGSGAIRLSQIKPASIRAQARSGAIKVKLVPGAGYAYKAQSESGKISIPPGNGEKPKTPRYLTGNFGNGGPPVDLRTKSSSITIER